MTCVFVLECEELVPIPLTCEELVPIPLTCEELVPIPLTCEELVPIPDAVVTKMCKQFCSAQYLYDVL